MLSPRHSPKCCSMLWQVSCSRVSCSRSRITSPTVLGMASCSGDAEMPHGVCRGALICGGKVWDTPASNPTRKCHVRLGNSAWLRPSEATKGLWARGSLTPPTFTDGKIEKQSSEITYLRSPKEAVEELGIKRRFHESPNHTASPQGYGCIIIEQDPDVVFNCRSVLCVILLCLRKYTNLDSLEI